MAVQFIAKVDPVAGDVFTSPASVLANDLILVSLRDTLASFSGATDFTLINLTRVFDDDEDFSHFVLALFVDAPGSQTYDFACNGDGEVSGIVLRGAKISPFPWGEKADKIDSAGGTSLVIDPMTAAPSAGFREVVFVVNNVNAAASISGVVFTERYDSLGHQCYERGLSAAGPSANPTITLAVPASGSAYSVFIEPDDGEEPPAASGFRDYCGSVESD